MPTAHVDSYQRFLQGGLVCHRIPRGWGTVSSGLGGLIPATPSKSIQYIPIPRRSQKFVFLFDPSCLDYIVSMIAKCFSSIKVGMHNDTQVFRMDVSGWQIDFLDRRHGVACCKI